MPESDIVIRGAREHNLRNVNLVLPRNQLIVMTGVSGSGKSSLAFDTLYAEGQRRYVESLSSYARQFLGQMPKPEVDAITGLAPSISIQQKSSGRNPRSTVGTITEIYDYLRVLFARAGQGFCPTCDRPITAQSRDQIIETLQKLPDGTRFVILAPVVQRQKGEYRDLFEDLLKQGYLRARVDGRIVQLTENLHLDKQMKHTIDVVVDRLKAGPATRTRLAEAVENALRLGSERLLLAIESDQPADAPPPEAEDAGQPATNDRLFSTRYACTHCGVSYEPPSPQLFSFNNPQGMCLECNGLGMRHEFTLDSLIPDDSLSLNDGLIPIVGAVESMGRWRRHIYEGVSSAIEKECGLKPGKLLDMPWKKLSEKVQQLWLYGTGDRNITFAWKHGGGTWKHGGTFGGLIPELLDEYRKSRNPMRRKQLEKHLAFVPCTACHGARLNPQARSVRIATAHASFGSKKSKSLTDVCALTIAEAARFFEELTLDDMGRLIAEEVLKEIRGRLGFLLRCGLDYLTLDRTAPTLSGGETQRIRLAGQIGCGLVGVVYILDEPSIGLHPRDNDMLLGSLLDLRDQGNTVIVVEHDEDTMRAADHIVDFGPGPGVRGGEVVAVGTLEDVKNEPRSLTGKYLSGAEQIAVPATRRAPGKKSIQILGAKHNNLRNLDVTIPLECFVCVTGVSGSGKSSLVNDILWEVLNRDLNKGLGNPGEFKKIKGLEHLDKAIDIDQSPIGRTPRSNPATYVKLFDLIRDLYTQLPDSKLRGYKAGRFSFNVASGRCEACEGHGATKLEMDFLADVWMTCPVCNGQRFKHETLDVKFKGLSIAEVLNLDIQQGLEHFENISRIRTLLQTLHDVGLDYLKLGQPSPTLSGGEAQRIKLARELGKRSTGKTIYLLDEPTTGLHFADVHKLLDVLQGFVAAGNTVLVVEHNLDVIKTADWVIDLGPEGGSGGGAIVAQGTPEEIAQCKASHTGRALRTLLGLKPFSNGQGANKISLRKRTDSSFDVSKPIVIQGAAQHNLQNVDIELPRHKLSIFCGPSGSGKSSLAMDTLYAEGQRRYVESLSSYARQFLGQMPKPKVEHVSGLSPAIAIEQKTVGNTPRSTIGTVTEIYDYLRILYARLGEPWCPDCDIPVKTQTTDEVLEKLLSLPEGTKLLVVAPHVVEVGESYDKLWPKLTSQGFRRVRIDGATYTLDAPPQLDRKSKHDVGIIVDRVTIQRAQRGRLADSVEAALDLGKGWMQVVHVDDSRPEAEWKTEPFSLHKACRQCGRSFPDLTPHSFSFNSALGWCPACEGLGVQQGTNLSALIADPRMTLRGGAVSAWPDPATNELFQRMLAAMSQQLGLQLDTPFDALDPRYQRIVLFGTGERWIQVPAAESGSEFKIQYKGLYPAIEEAARLSMAYRLKLNDLTGEVACTACSGSRLRSDAAAVRFHDYTMSHLCHLPMGLALEVLQKIKLKGSERKVAGDLLHEVTSRMSFLVNVGLHYLTLGRTMPTLSGGESQRIRLAGQIGRALTGVLYVLDEPTIGLHPRDNGRLLQALKQLRDLGNTVVLVEHDREVLQAADRLYDFGPGAGRLGGTIVGQGTPKQLERNNASLTGRYLANKEAIPVPTDRREPSQWLELKGCRHHNLRSVTLRIPLGLLTCITGVSGSGKSSLIQETLAPAVARRLHHSRETPGPFDEILGVELINKVIVVDQQPLGSTPASNPATYTGVFEHIRELFARLPEAKVRGYRPARFSFNRAGGRCEACEGNGQKKIEMHFLPDVWVECDVCRGKRFNAETLAVRFHDHSIADVLNMPIGEALELFKNIPKIRAILATLSAVGLDYLTLGQSAATLSGGEAQRVKLASELARPQTGQTLYLLDEPTTGLHFDDIRKLLKVLHSLVEQGNSVVVIEHNLDVVKTADWLIDLGPEAGADGGHIVAAGTPEFVVQYALANPSTIHPPTSTQLPSHTGLLLAPLLASGPRGEREIFDAAEAAKKKAGDLDLRQVGKEAKMPWQVDGRKWHVEDRVSHGGKPCRWEGSALALVIDAIAADGGFKDPNWNDRTVVEVCTEGKADGWFLHALTADEWLLTLKFRVAKNTFKEAELRKELALKSLDELDELPVYGRSDRVKATNLKGPWQEVTISVHWLREIDTPAFKRFLQKALTSSRGKSDLKKLNLDDLTPWKILGKKWHLSRKGFTTNKRVAWEPPVLEQLFAALETALPSAQIDWTGKTTVSFNRPSPTSPAGEPWAVVYTKRREGIDLTLIAPPGKFALGRIATLGSSREITTKDGSDHLQIRLDSPTHLDTPALRDFLKDHARA